MSLRARFLSIFTAALAIAAFSTITFAQDDKAVTPAPDKEKAERQFRHGDHQKGEGFGHRGGGMRGMGMMRGFHDLNLTDAQKTQIHSIMEANKPDKAAMEQFHTLAKAKHDGTITADQEAQLKALREQRQVKMRSVHEQMLNVLTAEQRATLEQKKAEMKARREEFRQKREEWRKQKEAAPSTKTDQPKVN
jgi:Spy/CpxP family protein refolding chaperone